MTYCEEVGLKVGDKINCFRGVITLHHDDGSSCPWFYDRNLNELSFDLKNREWEKVVEEVPTDTTASVVTKDTIVNVELTLGELFVIHAMVGNSGIMFGNLYRKVVDTLPLVGDKDPISFGSKFPFPLCKFDKWVDSHFMSPAKAKAKELRKQAEELIKQAEELEGK